MWIPSQFPHHTLHTSFISHPSASPTPTPSTNPKPTHQKPFQSIMSYGLCPRLSPPSPNLPFQLSSAHSPDCQEMMALGGKHRSASLRIAPHRSASLRSAPRSVCSTMALLSISGANTPPGAEAVTTAGISDRRGEESAQGAGE